MNSEENKRQEYFRRIRRLKRILRPLPRRATIHRYPVLKWFAATARKRSDLWSFRREQIVPAIYVGSILALLPPPTPQMPLTFLLALIIRCNLMVAAALTFITNPLTIAPLYYADYKIGGFVLDTFWHPSLMEEVSHEVVEMISGETGAEVEITIGWMQKFLKGWTQTAVGGLILGAVFAVAIHLAYLLIVRYYKKRNKANPFGLLGKFKRNGTTEETANAAEATSPAVAATPDNASAGDPPTVVEPSRPTTRDSAPPALSGWESTEKHTLRNDDAPPAAPENPPAEDSHRPQSEQAPAAQSELPPNRAGETPSRNPSNRS